MKYRNVNKMNAIDYSIAFNSCIFTPNLINKLIEDTQLHSRLIRIFMILIKYSKQIFLNSNNKNSNSIKKQYDIYFGLKRKSKRYTDPYIIQQTYSLSNDNDSTAIKSTNQLISYQKFKEVGLSARSLLELLKNINRDIKSNRHLNVASSTAAAYAANTAYERINSKKITQEKTCSNNNLFKIHDIKLKTTKKKFKNFVIKSVLRSDKLKINIDKYLKSQPAIYIKYNSYSSNRDNDSTITKTSAKSSFTSNSITTTTTPTITRTTIDDRFFNLIRLIDATLNTTDITSNCDANRSYDQIIKTSEKYISKVLSENNIA